MIKKFSIIVFLFAFSAQSVRIIHPNEIKKKSDCSAQLRGNSQRNSPHEEDKFFFEGLESDTEDFSEEREITPITLFFEGLESDTEDFSEDREITPITRSNKPKNLGPTDRAQSKRKKHQPNRAFLDKRHIKREELIKKIKEIVDIYPEITKKELRIKLNRDKSTFYDFLKNLQEKNFQLFEELNLKYPNIFCLKIRKKNEKKESEFEKISQNMVVEKIKNKNLSMKTMFNRIKEILADNPQIDMYRLAEELAIPKMTLITNLKALRLQDRQKFDELDNLSAYGLLEKRKKKKGNATLEDRSIKYPKIFSINRNEKEEKEENLEIEAKSIKFFQFSRPQSVKSFENYFFKNEKELDISSGEDFSEEREITPITRSNSLKKLRPTGYRESDRREDQAIRSLLNKQSAHIQKLIKKIEETLNKNSKINKKKLSEKLGIFVHILHYHIIKIKKESPQLFKILNKKYPKIFNIKEKSKESIESVLKKIEKILDENPKINNKTILSGILKISIQNFKFFLKRAHKENSELFKKLATQYPSLIVVSKREKKETKLIVKEGILIEKIEKIINQLIEENKNVNKEEFANKLNITRGTFFVYIKKIKKTSPESFKILSEKYPKIFNTKEKPRLSIESVLKKIEKILTNNPKIKNKSKLSEMLNKKPKDFEYFLIKAHKENSELFNELAKDHPSLILIGKKEKKETKLIVKEGILIEKIEKIINQLIEENKNVNKKECANKLNITRGTFFLYIKKIKKTSPESFKILSEKYPKIFNTKEKPRLSIESVLKKIEKILTNNPKIKNKSKLSEMLNKTPQDFEYFLIKTHKENSELFKKLSEKYPFLMNKSKKNNLEPEDETIQYMKLKGTPSFQDFSFKGEIVMDQSNSDYGSNSSESEDDDLGK